MNILAFTKYSYEGPSSRYRFYNYQEYFYEYDICMKIQPLFSKAFFIPRKSIFKIFIVFWSYLRRLWFVFKILIRSNTYDLVLIEYELLPYTPSWLEYLLKIRGIKYLVDYDDAIFHKYDQHKNILVRKLLSKKIANVMQYAKTVIVCNTYLEAYAKKLNKDTFILPTVVQIQKYIKAMSNYKKRDKNKFVIGWIGSRTTGVYIVDILPAIKKFVQKYENVCFHLVGFDEQLLTKEEKVEGNIEIIKWEEEEEIEEILAFDVGIMPLPDDSWSRGKCGFKLIQYMSCKKPVIASSVGMNCDLIQDGTNGILVDSLKEWFDAFEKLYLDNKLQTFMSTNNFIKIETEYNNKVHAGRYIDLLKNNSNI